MQIAEDIKEQKPNGAMKSVYHSYMILWERIGGKVLQ